MSVIPAKPGAKKRYVIPIRDGLDQDWTQEDMFNKRFDHLVANTLHSDMFVRIKKSGQLVPAHRFAIGSASERLKRLVYGGNAPVPTGPDEVKDDAVETVDGKPVLVIADIQPEHCHAVSNNNSVVQRLFIHLFSITFYAFSIQFPTTP